MKIRILEIKEEFSAVKFKPQYKTFLFWKDIGDTSFAESIFCSYKLNNDNTIYSKSKAEKILSDFKKYISSKEEYIIEHKYD